MGRGGLVVIFDDKMIELNKSANMKLRSLYESGSGIILTIGDGDLSFSTSLASEFKMKFADGTTRLIATTYDSQSQLISKYPTTVNACLETLKKLNIPVLHNIDATKLYQTLEVNRYRALKRPDHLPIPKYEHNCSKIIFNFPYLGNLGTTSLDVHKELIKNFFIECFPLLIRPTYKNNNENGEVLITTHQNSFFDKLQIIELAQHIGYKLIDQTPFRVDQFPGYEEQKTTPSLRLQQQGPMKSEPATLYRFIIDPQYVEHLEKTGFFDIKPIDTTNLNAYTKSIMPTEILAQNETPTTTTDSNSKSDPLTNSIIKSTPITTTTTTTTTIDKTTPVTDLSTISPYQIVSIQIDSDILNKNNFKLPIHTPTQLPSHSMLYYPIYPRCPPPPPPSTTTTTTTQPTIPTGLFSFYHTILSTADQKNRNFRVGMQELRKIIEKPSNQITTQLKEYSDELLSNGALVIKLTRAHDYEKYYRADLFAANESSSSTTTESSSTTTPTPTTKKKYKAVQETMIVNGKKRIISRMVLIKDDENQQLIKSTKKQTYELPLDKRLYIGNIIGILGPTNVSLSQQHLIANEKKSQQNTDDDKKKSKVRKATTQDVMNESLHTNSKQKTKAKMSFDDNIPDEELSQFLGDGLAFDIATTQNHQYKLGYKEREQLRLQRLQELKTERVQKKIEYQAQRRVQHCVEKGTKAKTRDVELVEKLKQEKSEQQLSKHQRKQERRIAKMSTDGNNNK